MLRGECPSDKMCINCEDSICKECQGAYVESGVCVKPSSTVNNCLSYSNKDSCMFCDFGYFLESNSCKEIKIEGCAIAYKEIDSCVACKNGIRLIDGKCDVSNKCDEENCDICAAGVCLLCKAGFSLTNLSKCIEQPIENCAETTADNKGCAVCDLGFYDTNEECLKSSPIQQILSLLLIIALM